MLNHTYTLIKNTSLALACLAVIARGQTPAEKMRTSILDEVVVTATRSENKILDTPATVHVVGREDFLGRRNVRSFADALQETPGVVVQRTGYAQASPIIRGFTGFRTLALVDGIRLNNAVFREGPNQYWSTIDAYSIERLEVVKGPSSVLYGSDAIGGTVNAITRKPSLITWPEKADGKTTGKSPVATVSGGPEMHGAAIYRYASAENSHTARGEFDLALSPQLGVAGGITYKDYDDLRGGDLTGKQRQSGYTEFNGDFTAVWRPTEKTQLTLGFQRFEQNNAPRWHSTIYSRSFDGTTTGTDLRRDFDQLRELGYARLEMQDLSPWLSKASVTLSYNRQSEEQDRIRDDGRRDVDGFQDDQSGIQIHLESPTAIGLLSYGVEYYHDEVDSWGSRWNPDGSLRTIKQRGPVADDASYDMLGIYVQDEIKVGKKLTIIPGARWTWAQADTGTIDPDSTDATVLNGFTEDFDALTFSLRANYAATQNWNIFTGISQGFRAPNLSDYTSFDIARSGEQETPTTDLSPEQYLSFEIGTKFTLPDTGLDFYAAYYHTWIDDQIVRYPTGGTIDGSPEVKRANSGDGYVQGVELGLSWNFSPGWTAFGDFTWSEGEVGQYNGKHIGVYPVTRIQPITAHLGVRWNSTDSKWWTEGVVTLARHQDRLSLGDIGDTQRIPPGGTGGYAVYTVRAGWKPCANLDVYAACENLSDEDYRIHGSGINEPGRNFVLGTKIAF